MDLATFLAISLGFTISLKQQNLTKENKMFN